MDGMAILSSVLGIAIRLVLPLAVTLLVAYGLRRLDQRWQEEAAARQTGPMSFIRCWVLNDCPDEKRANCPVFQEKNLPCWQVFRDEAGRLPSQCLGCEVFRRAPALETI
jgi:hypothetical protein